MHRLQEISKLPKEFISNWFNSIDYVFFDIDGVLFHNRTPIAQAENAVAKIRNLGKQVAFVTNNTTHPLNIIKDNLKSLGATEAEIIFPVSVLLLYLKKIKFDQDIYVISCSWIKDFLRAHGYNVKDYKDIHSGPVPENLSAVKEMAVKTLEVCKHVGAIYVDIDYNMTIGSVQAAKVILNHKKDVLFLSGLNDDTGNIGDNFKTIGSKFYLDGLERWTKKESITMAKPGSTLKEVLKLKYNILDDNRVLFIGDNVATDIAFGVNCGYQTCLALSGITSKSEVENWTFPENHKPTYVMDSIAELYEKIKQL